eukprot:g71999.t1
MPGNAGSPKGKGNRPREMVDRKWMHRSKHWEYEFLYLDGTKIWVKDVDRESIPGFWTLLETFNAARSKRLQLVRQLGKDAPWEVECILDERTNKKRRCKEYLVKWKDWGHSYNSWQTESDFIDSEALKEYQEKELQKKMEARVLAKRRRVEALVASAHKLAPAVLQSMEQSELERVARNYRNITTRKTGFVGEDETGKIFSVDKIVGHRKLKGRPHEYLVKWTGWGPNFNSWQKKNDFNGFSTMYAAFRASPTLEHCGRCDLLMLDNSKLMRQHCLQEHNTENNEFVCKYGDCKQIFSLKQEYDAHYLEHLKPRRCPSTSCGAILPNSAEYDAHMKEKHVFCQLCPTDCFTQEGREKHMDTHHPLLCICPQKSCGTSFFSKGSLLKHINTKHHGQRKQLLARDCNPRRLCNLNGEIIYSSKEVEKRMRAVTVQGKCTAEYIRPDHVLPIVVKYINDKKGFGAFASRDVKQGEWIGSYGGIVVDDEWLSKNGAENSQYLFCLTDKMYVNGTQEGNLTRFINHIDDSSPNILTTLGNHWGLRVPLLHAARDVAKGDEFTIDYRAGEINRSTWDKSKANAKKRKKATEEPLLRPLYPKKFLEFDSHCFLNELRDYVECHERLQKTAEKAKKYCNVNDNVDTILPSHCTIETAASVTVPVLVHLNDCQNIVNSTGITVICVDNRQAGSGTMM